MRQLIVNADDFGLTEQVSRGILDAHRDGIVTSTTLMANGAAFDAAVAMSRQAPRLGIGVHLNLVKFAQKYQMRNRILAKSLPALR
jgi:chitin disaccharide deacetylase